MARRNRQNSSSTGKRPDRSSTPKTSAAQVKAPASRSSARPGWTWPLAFAALVALVAGYSLYLHLHSSGPAPEKPIIEAAMASIDTSAIAGPDNTGPEAGYIGSQACAECHQGITNSFNHIAMGRSLYRPTVDNIIENYDTDNEFYHEASDQYFRMTHDNDHFYQTRYQKAPDGSHINEKKVEVSYIVGSGNHSRSYVHREPDGKVYQLPVAWYSQEKKWDMNPGYDSGHHINFSRRITYDCLFCHAAYPDVPKGADLYNYGETSFFPDDLKAIDCERCHGPAAQHVTLAKQKAAVEAVKAAIVNTGNLSNELQLEVCMQCHLETTSGKLPHSVHALDKGIFGYRPGEPLQDYRYAFDHPKGTGHDDKFEIAGQAYRMRMSPCFIKSEGRMTCTTCHDPHRVPKDRIAAGIQSCLLCHKPADCTEDMQVRLKLPIPDNCIQCHMPQRRTDDVVNVVMTDHYIQRRPPPEKVLLAPKKEHPADYHGDVALYYPQEIAPDVQELYMGLAQISNSADLEKGIDYLNHYLTNHPKKFVPVYTRGVALKVLGRMTDARTDLEEAVKLKPNNPQAWMALGDLYENMQTYDRSLKCYQAAIKIAPNLSRSHNGAGTSMLLAGNTSGAEAEFHKAVARDPFDENPHMNLAAIYLRSGEMASARAEAKAALAINPGNAGAWVQLAEAALAQGKADEAIWTTLQALNLDGTIPDTFNLLLSACRAAKPPTAVKTLEKTAKRQPFAAHIAAALMQLEQNNPPAAESHLQLAAAAQTTCPAAMSAALKAALAAGRADLALFWGEQAHQAQPQDEDTLINYAQALEQTGSGEKAMSQLQAALANARSPRLLNAMAWLYATATDPALRNGEQASRLAEEAADALGQPNIFIMQSQAAAAAEMGQYPQAAAIAEKALSMATNESLNIEAQKIQNQLTQYHANAPYRK